MFECITDPLKHEDQEEGKDIRGTVLWSTIVSNLHMASKLVSFKSMMLGLLYPREDGTR